jgi:hypothetical protein
MSENRTKPKATHLTRRSFLKTTAVATGTLALASSVGCSSIDIGGVMQPSRHHPKKRPTSAIAGETVEDHARLKERCGRTSL